MTRLLLALPLLVVATSASAQNLPKLDLTCPTDIRVHADAGGPVYINDKQATLHKFSEQYFEAKSAGVTVSISLDGKGTPTVSYTGTQGANGICAEAKEPQESNQAQAE
ncbi:MAG TPA: hypothetical protein VLC30_15115 [Pseudomonas sp.]|nr:hypothetical protein [Pseudomonas sp.]